MNEDRRPGARLERALEAFLTTPPTSAADADRLLSQHPDLHDVLAPMLAVPQAGDDGDAAGVVLGDFRLVRELGRGGMGIVHEAWQRSLDRRVAVKVLPPGLVADPASVARFRREAAAAARLRHPHIVEVLGFGQDGGQHFLAMQYVHGPSLQQCADDFRSPERAVALAAQLAEALAHAHGHGLVHRDVKPANVLIDHAGDALLGDFGVARDTAQPSLTREGGFVGTLDYAAPEQLRGERVDGRADVWSLGVILHELLAGVRPFAAATQQATMRNILVAEPPSLRAVPGVSRDLAAVVDRALQKDPSRRYASAAALAHDLRALQRGEPVAARLPTTVERLGRRARRGPRRAVAAPPAPVLLPAPAGAGGYLLANAPRIDAARADEVRRDRETRLARATFDRAERRWDDALAVLAPLPAGDPEVDFLRAWIQLSADRRDEARATLRPHTVPCFELVRQVVDAQPLDEAELRRPPTDALDAYVRTALLLDLRKGRRTTRLDRVELDLALHALLSGPSVHAGPATLFALVAIQHRDEAAIALAERTLAAHFPHDPTALRLRAMLLSEGDASAAVPWIDSLPPDPVYAAHLASARGRALERLGDLDGAAARFREATTIDPDRAADWANLGTVLRKRGAHDEALAALERARTARPNDPYFANLLALTLRDAGRLDEAEALLVKVVARARTYAPAAYNLGNLRLRRGDVEGAITAFRRAVEIDPNDVRHLSNLGDALARADRLHEALAMSLWAGERAPDAFVPPFNAARLALQLGIADLALRSARRASANADGDPRGGAVLAEALLAQDPPDVPAALEAARRADAAAGGADLHARVQLARALAANGEGERAAELLREALAAPAFAAAAAQQELRSWLEQLARR